MSPKTPSKRLYLRNLPKHINSKSLLKHLSIYGKITEVKIVHDYAFVQFESQKDAEDVVDTFRDQPFLGENITVEFSRPIHKGVRSTGGSKKMRQTYSNSPKPVPDNAQCRYPIVVSNIPPRIRWQELKDFGRQSGGLVAFCDLDRKHRGRGFVEYFTKEDAEQAIAELDNKFLGGQRVRVSGRPENGMRGRSRSRSPRQREATFSRSYDYHGYSYNSARKSRSQQDEYSYDRHMNECRNHHYRGSPPPAYHPAPSSPIPRHEGEDRNLKYSPGHYPSDLATTMMDLAIPRTASDLIPYFPQEPQYEEQYDYASHSTLVDAWKHDCDYSAGYVADPFEVPVEQSIRQHYYDVPEFFQPI